MADGASQKDGIDGVASEGDCCVSVAGEGGTAHYTSRDTGR